MLADIAFNAETWLPNWYYASDPGSKNDGAQ